MATAAEKERFAEGTSYACPACDSELYPWSAARDPIDRSMIVVDRCEVCRLSVTRGAGSPDVEAELAAWGSARGGEIVTYRAPNQRSIQGGLGGAQWAGLEPDKRRLHLNPDAIERLLKRRGSEVQSVKARFTFEGYRSMLQTLINAFTLRDNFFQSARAGVLPTSRGRERLEYGIDMLVTVLVAAPLAMVAGLLEGIGALTGRAGEMQVKARAERDFAGA